MSLKRKYSDSKTKLGDSKTPALSDPGWENWTRETWLFLARPRTWWDLNEFRRTINVGPFMIRHYLAYLEHAGKARSFERDPDTFWVQTGIIVVRSELPPSRGTVEPLGTDDEGPPPPPLPDPVWPGKALPGEAAEPSE